MKVLPSIFQQRAIMQQEQLRWEDQIRNIPGGAQLLKDRNSHKPVATPIAYLVPDSDKDAAAALILSGKQISAPEACDDGLTFSCYSSLALPFEDSPMTYSIFLGFGGTANCSCKDFCQRGGACKHIRSALLRLGSLQTSSPHLRLPASVAVVRF